MFQTEVQRAVTRYLQGQTFFATEPGIPVVAQNDVDLLSKMAAAIGSLGIVVLVAPLGGKYGHENTNAPYFDPARFTVRVRENIQVNRSLTGSGQPADYVAEVCAQLLKHYVPVSESGQPLSGGGIIVTAINPGDDDKGIYAFDCLFELAGALAHEPVRREFRDDNQLN